MAEFARKPTFYADKVQPNSVAQPELPFDEETDTLASGLAAIGSESVRIATATWSLGDSPPDGYDTRENNAWHDLGGNIPCDQLEQKRLKRAGEPRVINVKTKKRTLEPYSGPEVEMRVNEKMREFVRVNKTRPTNEEIIEMSQQAERELRNSEVS